MSWARLWRTVRHLSSEQVFYAVLRRLRHRVRRRWPDRARHRVAELAQALPFPDPRAASLARIAGDVRALQTAVYDDADGIAAGRFSFLGRRVDFGALKAIDWRRDLQEESSPLWRLTLAYFGWAVLLIEKAPEESLTHIARAVTALEQAGDWTAAGIFRDLWNPYTASHRLINLLVVLHRYHAREGRVAAKDKQIILDHIRFCAAHIAADLERDLQFNHLLKNYVALAVFRAASSTTDVFDWLEQAVPHTLRQLILGDGGHAERSPMYHALGLLDLRHLRDTGLFREAWSPELGRCIPAMESALACLLHPDGDIALFGDSWLGGAPAAATLQLPKRQTGIRTRLPQTGYACLDGGEDYVVLDCGPLGAQGNPAHGHADYLSIEASLAGCRLIVDFGTPTYVTGALRTASRLAAAHNGPRVIDKEPAELWQSFRAGRRGQAGSIEAAGLAVAPLWAAGWQDGYADLGIELRRWVGLWPGEGFIVADLWLHGSAASYASDFLVAGPWQPILPPGVGFTGPVPLDVVSLAGRVVPLGSRSWWPRYGESAAATGLRLVPDDGGFAVVGFFRSSSGRPDRSIVEVLRVALAQAPGSTAAAV